MYPGKPLAVFELGRGSQKDRILIPSEYEQWVTLHPKAGPCVRAFKVGQLNGMLSNQPSFSGVLKNVPYGFHSRANCALGHDHTPPDENCVCGFYAVADSMSPVLRRFSVQIQVSRGYRLGDVLYVLLEVALTGKVIVYEHDGETCFRGQRQTVLAYGPAPCAHERNRTVASLPFV
jgi:hypothetical protein